MKTLKKIIAYTLLFTGFMPVLFTLFFLCKQQLIRHEIKEKLEQQMLHTVIVPEAEVAWVKYKKEIRIHDKMFDVKSFTIKKDQYIFTGLYDDEETALNNYFEKNTEQKNERGNQLLAAFFQLLQSMYSGDSNAFLISKNNSRIYCCLILSNISAPIKNILTPPPQAPIIVYFEYFI
jgi:hypothetical protein